MPTTYPQLARLAVSTALYLSATAAMAAMEGVPQSGTFDTPQGTGTFQSGTTDLTFSSDWFDYMSMVNLKQAPIEPSFYPVTIALEGVRSDGSVVSPVTIAAVDGAQSKILGVTSAGGLRIDRPALNGLSSLGSLSITNMYADFATGLVYGTVNGANGVGVLSGVALWQAQSMTGQSDNFVQDNQSVTQVIHVGMQDLALTTEGVNVFSRALGMGQIGMNSLPYYSIGSFNFGGAFTVPANTNLTTPEFAPVPEPGTWALMGLGLVGLFGATRRRA